MNNLNIINNNNSLTMNIIASNRINFNVDNTQLTKIDTTGLSIYHPALEIFLTMMAGIILEIDLINYFMLCLILQTVSGEQDTVNQRYYPRPIQFQTYQGTTFQKLIHKVYNY